jgi:hypothetical protein
MSLIPCICHSVSCSIYCFILYTATSIPAEVCVKLLLSWCTFVLVCPALLAEMSVYKAVILERRTHIHTHISYWLLLNYYETIVYITSYLSIHNCFVYMYIYKFIRNFACICSWRGHYSQDVYVYIAYSIGVIGVLLYPQGSKNLLYDVLLIHM